jgi:hypothetical protein
LVNYTKQAKEFMVKMKKEDIENDFKSTWKISSKVWS